MSDRFQTTSNGGVIEQRASGQLSDHVTVAMRLATNGRRAYIKARTGEVDDRLWCVEFAPNHDEPHRPFLTPLAYNRAVTFDQPGNPGWIRQVRTIADRLTPIPGGTP